MPVLARPPRGTNTVGFLFGVCRAQAIPGPIMSDLLSRMGISKAAGRQLVARLQAAGLLTSQRQGRVSVYRMAGQMLDGFNTIRCGEPPDLAWEGSFHLVIYDLPERDRIFRDQLRTAANASGFAAWRPGVLVGCSPSDGWLAEFLEHPGRKGTIEDGRWQVELPSARRVAARAWELDTYRGVIEDGISQLHEQAGRHLDSSWDLLRQMHETFAVASPIWLAAPKVPAVLLPDDWPMGRLTETAFGVVAQNRDEVSGTLEEFLTRHPYAALLQRYSPAQWVSNQPPQLAALYRPGTGAA